MTVCDSLVSSKLCALVLEHLLNSLSFTTMIPFAQNENKGSYLFRKNCVDRALCRPFPEHKMPL